jgi:hypothetical protein
MFYTKHLANYLSLNISFTLCHCFAGIPPSVTPRYHGHTYGKSDYNPDHQKSWVVPLVVGAVIDCGEHPGHIFMHPLHSPFSTGNNGAGGVDGSCCPESFFDFSRYPIT